MTTVSFEVHLVLGNNPEEIPEAALTQNLEAYREILLQQEVIEGVLVIEVPDQPAVRVYDELSPIVQNLCFTSIKALLEAKRESFLYHYMSYDGHIVMLPLASLVRVFGESDDTPTITANGQELLPALFNCGVRFMQLLEDLGGDASATAAYLQPFADEARTILQQHQLL